jgi:hypothetical protein
VISLPDLLRRLRRAWAPPGPALARVAPPTDTAALLRAEIQPLLQAISELQKAAEAVRSEAARTAAQQLDAAAAAADRTARDAENAAPASRAAGAKQKREVVEAEIAKVVADGDERVAAIQAMSKERLAGLAEEVKACVLAGAGEEAKAPEAVEPGEEATAKAERGVGT